MSPSILINPRGEIPQHPRGSLLWRYHPFVYEGVLKILPYERVHRCMGQWVICHTRHRGSIPGRLVGCNESHLFLHVQPFGLAAAEQQVRSVDLLPDDQSGIVDLAYYPAYGYGRTAVALTSVVGLTAIGLSALWW